MAEFQEVMQQLGRICQANLGECAICDLRPLCPSKTFLDTYVKSGRTERLEKMVLSWAAEHPMPEYPSWIDFLSTVGLIIQTNDCTTCAFDFTKAYTQIPADIAEKLGLQPKEVRS